MNEEEEFYRWRNEHLSLHNGIDNSERQDYTGHEGGGQPHTKYYDKLIRSGKIGGHDRRDKGTSNLENSRLRKSVSCSETNLVSQKHPFVFPGSGDAGLPYNPSGQKKDRDRWLSYAMNIKPRQKGVLSRSETTSSNPNLSISEYFHSLYQRYPHSFQRRLQRDSESTQQRPSRRLFSSGLRVHFNDEVYVNNEDETQSVCSERPVVTKWDQEIERIFGSKYANSKRSCLTNPTPSMVSDLSLTQRLHGECNDAQSENEQDAEVNGNTCTHTKINSQSSRRSSASEEISFDEHVRLLEQALKDNENQQNKFRRRLDFCDKDFGKNDDRNQLESDLQWGTKCPDSPPDSAIDIDTSSVQSSVSVNQSAVIQDPNRAPPKEQISQSDKSENLDLDYQPGQQSTGQELELTSGLQKAQGQGQVSSSDFGADPDLMTVYQDSDIDSGIVPSSSDPLVELAKKQRSPTPVFSSQPARQRPSSAVPFNKPPRPPSHPTPRPRKGGNSKRNKQQSTDSEDDEALMREVTLAQMSRDLRSLQRERRRGSRGADEDDFDDSDPRLGIARITDDERIIAEKYRMKRKPAKYCLVRGSSTARDRPTSAPIWQKSASDDRISILCTPRPVDINKNEFGRRAATPQPEFLSYKNSLDHCEDERPLRTSTIRQTNEHNTRNDPHGNFVHQSSTLPPRNRHFHQRLEQRIRKHSRGYSSSNESSVSDVSENTLVASQLSLNDQRTNTQQLQQPSALEDFPIISDHNAKRKIHLKKIFKIKRGSYNPVSDDSHLSVGCHGNGENVFAKFEEVDQNYQSGNVQFKRYASDGDLLNQRHELSSFENKKTNTTVPQINNSAPHSPVVPRLTPYEASVINMDKNGVDVDEIIESDSDSMFSAIPAIVQKGLKGDNSNTTNAKVTVTRERKTAKEMVPESDISSKNETKFVTVCPKRESANSLPESNSSNSGEHFSLTSVSSTETTSMPSVIHKKHKESKASNSTANVIKTDVKTEAKSETGINNPKGCQRGDNSNVYSVPEISVYDTVEESKGNKVRETKPGEDDSPRSEHVYAKVTYRTAENAGRRNIRTNGNIRCVSEGFHGDGSRYLTSNQGSNMRQQKALSTSNIAADVGDILPAGDDGPPIPNRNYHGSMGNLQKNKELSGSRLSLSNKVGNLKNAAKNKFQKLRKAMSMEKGLNRAPSPAPDGSEKVVKSKPPKTRKGLKLKNIFGKKASKHRSTENLHHGAVHPPDTGLEFPMSNSIDSLESPTQENCAIGRLREVKPDGTQVIELTKPSQGPLGFYISRGNAEFNHGFFVSRFAEDQDPRSKLAGLLSVGDEILEINEYLVNDMTLDDVYDVLAQKRIVTMRILPLLARKDV